MIQVFHGVYDAPLPGQGRLLAAFEDPGHADSYLRHMERIAQTCNPVTPIRFSIGPVRVRTLRRALPRGGSDRRCVR